MKLVNTIIIASHIPVLATGISALLLYRQSGRALKVFSYFIFLSVIVQFVSLGLFFAGKNNMPVLHFYVAAGLPCLCWFYKAVLRNFISTRIVWWTVVLFLAFTVINSLFVQHIFRFNSNALALESVIVITAALFTFIFFLNDTVKEAGVPDIQRLTWINSGLFIYYLSCLLIFYFGDAILFRFSRNLSGLTWIFHSFFSVVMYTCFLIGLWKRSKTPHL